MKILVVAPHPFYQDRGTPMDVDLLVRALSAQGETVDLLTYHEGEDRQYSNVRSFRIWAPRWLKNIRPGFSIAKLLCDVSLLYSAWQLVRNNRYQVIHAGEEAVFIAMLFRFLYGIPYVYDMDSSIAQQLVEGSGFMRPLAPLLNWCEAKAIRHSAAVAAVCPALSRLADRRGARAVVTLHDVSQIEEGDVRAEWALRKQLEIDGILAMYVGNLESYQGIDLLLDSFAMCRSKDANIELVIAGGQEDDIARYRRKAERLRVGEYLHFIGPWPAEKLGHLLACADILVAPRIKGINTPMKIFPYLHSGKPVLATNLPTHTQTLDETVAALAAPEPVEFGLAMKELAENKVLRDRLGSAGKNLVETKHLYAHHERRVRHLYDIVGAPGSVVPSQT